MIRHPRPVAFAMAAALFLLAGTAPGITGEDSYLHEDFRSLDAWEPFYFPRIREHSSYSLGHEDGKSFLVTRSTASASALMLNTTTINVHETPVLRWRWRVMNVYHKGDVRTKAGDDSPLRVYVMFEYDTGRATTAMRLRYSLARLLYGEYPPHASLNYIWASSAPRGSVLRSPYTERSRIVVLRSGALETGRWLEEEVNVLEDYQSAFGEDPPDRARLAVMNDSDNTGEASESHMEYIRAMSDDSP